MSKVLFVGIF